MAINIKKNKQVEAVEFVKSKYKASLEFQRPYFTKFNEYYQMYRAVREDGKQNYAGRAKLYIPYVFATIETIIPRLIGAKPKIQAVPREYNDIDNAKANTSLFDYQWDKLGMKEKLKLWVKQTLIYGNGVVKLFWDFRGDEESIIKDEPAVELVDLFDFYIDPNATTIDDAAYVIQRAERDIAELENNANYTVPKNLVAAVNEDQYKVQRDAILGLTKPRDRDAKKVEILEYWGKYDIDGKGEKECLLVVANQQYLIRAEANPYAHQQKPFISMLDIQIPHSFWGIGEVEQLKSLQYELNDIRNQRMDNVTLILNRMWKVGKNADVDEEDLVSQAGQTVHVGDMNGLEIIETPDVTASAYNEESLVKSDMQLVSGVNDYTRGGGESSGRGGAAAVNETATGIMLMQEAGNARFKYKLDNIEDALVRFGKQLLALNQQFLDTTRQIRIIGTQGAQWIDLQPDNIQGEFDVTVEAGSTQPMNKTVRRAEARELLQSVMPFAEFGIDVKYFIKYLLQTYDLTDIDQAFSKQAINPMSGLPQETTGGIQPGITASNNVDLARTAETRVLAGDSGISQQAGMLAGADNG